MIRYLFFLFLPFCFSSGVWNANDISGVWINSDKDAHIKIYSSYGKFYGHVEWMKNPFDSVTGKPQLDILNSDPALKSRPIMKMIVLKDLVFDLEEQEWSGGTIYNPKNGATYDAYCKMINQDTIEMHFYLSFRSIGKTLYWIRVKE